MNWTIQKHDLSDINRFKELGISSIFAKVLINRGIDYDTAKALLKTPEVLIEKNKIVNIDIVAKKIIEFLNMSNKEIWIFSDYDVDGITSGFLLESYLKEICSIESENIYTYYPDRIEGYGLNLDFCEEIVKRKKESNKNIFIITVDNGTSCFEQIKYLKENGIDIVVTDHHQAKESLPDCYVCNPHISPESPGHHLCGAGVAWKICKHIDELLNINLANKYLYAVAIATIGDIMPMAIENLALIRIGINQLNSSECPKNFELFKEKLKISNFTGENIAWEIAPKLNACGRMGDILSAVKLFFAREKEEINDCIISIIEYDAARKNISKKIEQEALKRESNGHIFIYDASEYPVGIIGPLASKLSEKHKKPAFVVQSNGDLLTGSARSVAGIDLMLLLKIEEKNGNIANYGGHKMACGLSIYKDKLNDFIEGINQTIEDLIQIYSEETTEDNNEKVPIVLDAELNFDSVSKKVYNELNICAYDHETFKAPIFLFPNLEVTMTKISKNNPDNICFTLRDSINKYMNIWAWGFAKKYEELGSPEVINIIGNLAVDFMHNGNFTIKVVDIESCLN